MSYLNFTTQQLQGGGKYSVKTKIGNYFEDQQLDEIKFKEFVRLKENNGLLVAVKEEKYAKMLLETPIVPLNGQITTGSYFMLKNATTNGYLVIDNGEKSTKYENAFSVTTNPLMNFSCPRALFKFEKYRENRTYNGIPEQQPKSTVCYNEKICIIAHHNVYKTPVYVYSPLLSPFEYSAKTRNQEVLGTPIESFYNCWTIEHVDPIKRFEVFGQPVNPDEPFLIRHFQTGKLLASSMNVIKNDYGREYELCANHYLPLTKFKKIEAEKDDKSTKGPVTRIEKPENIWCVVDKI